MEVIGATGLHGHVNVDCYAVDPRDPEIGNGPPSTGNNNNLSNTCSVKKGANIIICSVSTLLYSFDYEN